ncbi:MAG: Gfo/Idh/MocA family oxidoreductase [Armatimonadetes bacterium]|nr:Gfo/Idh/MocA family oxidoreductase [Armatimonadota bacterium]
MRIGFAGLIHGHVWGLIDRFDEDPGWELAAVADPTPLLEKAKDRFSMSYTDWRAMLDAETLDGLVVCSDNRESAEIAIEALERGVPCFVEKAMAADGIDAQRMLKAQRKSGKTLLINWPIAWSSWPYELHRQLQDVSLGQVFHFRFRTGHHGPKEIGCDEYFVGWLYDEHRNGGGAMADFCCYGAALSRWYFGKPNSVFAVRGNYTKAPGEVPDDHAVVVLKYPTMNCIIEGTWATFGFDESANPVVHAKNGTLGVYGNQVRRYAAGMEMRTFEGAAPPAKSPAPYFRECIQSGRVPEGLLDPEVAADAARIIELAVKSARTGCEEKF